MWISAQTPGQDNIQIGLGSAGKNGVEQTVANESTAPTAISFTDAASESAALTLGDWARAFYPIWVMHRAAR
jgi:hypothetical protein